MYYHLQKSEGVENLQENKTVDDVFMADENMTYDAAAKSFLANKVILARILKHCVKEFADCDLKDIEEKIH